MEAGAVPVTQPGPPKSRVLLILLGCGCAALLAFAAFVAMIVGGVLWATEAPFEAAHAHVNQVQAGDLAGAYGQLAVSLKEELSEEQFATFTQEWPVLYGAGSEWTVTNRNINNNTGRMEGKSVGKDGRRAAVVISLIYEEQAWRVQGINITRE